MLTPDEEKFMKYWEENRNKPLTGFRLYRHGLSIGFVLGIAILINYASGWYSRADMVANSQSTPLVLIVSIVVIALFCSFFYRQYQRENNEQRFKELSAKKEKQNVAVPVQQDDTKSSQIGN